MSIAPSFDDISPAIRAALEGRGFTALTPVQEAVLEPSVAGRDLRILSQTGSGKTVAVGLAMAPGIEEAVARVASAPPKPSGAQPFALVIAPTRELAAQIGRELTWLYATVPAEVATVTGGASYPRELAALRRKPQVVVGTPGRLLDHLTRGSIATADVGVVVLDEADQMLDLGFRDELEAILEKTPETRRTLLLSATFPREVKYLADRCQKDPIVAAGSVSGESNQDISHFAHLVLPEERDKALVNLLLLAPDQRALVFVRTREGASDLADRLSDRGLPARAIHGDLEQRDRTRTLEAFRSGAVLTLVATDVAARGIDVPDVARVIHADPPNDAEVLTHRSGRTGRAGKKGMSVILVPPAARERVRAMMRRAGIEPAWSPAPSAATVLASRDARLAAEILAASADAIDPRASKLAAELLAAADPTSLVAALIARELGAGPSDPFEIAALQPPPMRVAQTGPPPPRKGGRFATGREAPRFPDGTTRSPRSADGPGRAPEAVGDRDRGFVLFKINWGERQGADPRRLLALVCRRGGIRGADVGAIRIGPMHSTFGVASDVAAAFATAAREPDTRDPRIHITPSNEGGFEAPSRAPVRRPPTERGDDRPAERPTHAAPRGPAPAPRPAPHTKAPAGARTTRPRVVESSPEPRPRSRPRS